VQSSSRIAAAKAFGHRLGLLSDCAQLRPGGRLFSEFQMMLRRLALEVLQSRGVVLIECLHEQLQLFDAPFEFGRRQQQYLDVAR
jgi:hypothetical protein